MLLAGLDIGTTGCKTAVYSESGEYLGKVYRDYPVRRESSEHEINAADIWQAVQEVLSDTALKYPGIGGIGVTSFGETFVLLDDSDTPLLPSMLYTDPRGIKECDELTKKIGREKIVLKTGVAPASMYSLPKILWVKKNKPETWAKVKRICLIEDYIVYMLSGIAQIDYSLAARTMAFNIEKLGWDEDILNCAGISPDLFSKPVPTGSKAGLIRKTLAEKLTLNENTVIVSVSHDQVSAAIGSGVFDEGTAVDGAGTVECITPVFEKYDAGRMAQSNYAVVPYITEGKYVCYAFSFTGGALAEWYVKNQAGYAEIEAGKTDADVHEILEKSYMGSPTGLLVLPHFAGAATPYMDPQSKGAIIGLSLENSCGDVYIACLEGVCYEMRLNVERLKSAGVKITALRAAGGGTKSRAWMQMKADVLGIPITVLSDSDAGAAGSAMLTGIAAGVYENLGEAAKTIISVSKTYQPRMEAHAEYDAVYKRYEKLYDAVRPLV